MTRTVDDVIADLRELLLRKKHGVICMRPDDAIALVVEIEALRAAVRSAQLRISADYARQWYDRHAATIARALEGRT